MKILRLLHLTLFFSLTVSVVKAQFQPGMGYHGPIGVMPRLAINSGDVEGLRGVTSVNIIYDYSKLAVDAFRDEQDYLTKMKETFKDSTKFQKFRQNWFKQRKNYFEPNFEKAFNHLGKKIRMEGTNHATTSPITLKVETVLIETGSNFRMFPSGPSSIDLECTFIDKDGKEIVRYFIKNAPGSANDAESDFFDALSDSYKKAAKMLMKDIKKRLKRMN